ncbi:MAG: hypothetical protein IKJ55_06030 [Clostridia bacterium]|nr:hypothetical protein [Clostridia bacterium]
MYKTDIREQMKEKRGQLTQSEIVQKSQIICDEIIKRFPDRDMTVCLYFPIRNEVDIRPLFSFY